MISRVAGTYRIIDFAAGCAVVTDAAADWMLRLTDSGCRMCL
jgi:hypothetical protein